MKRTINIFLSIVIGFSLFSCGNNENTNKTKNETIAIHDTIAFISLESYEYVDNKEYGKSSNDRKLIINGTTNFPSGTNIKIDISGYVPSTREDYSSDTYGNAIVEDRKFKISLNPWNIPQTVQFRIFKDDQDAEVIKIFGDNGERIKLSEENRGEYPSICFFQSKEQQINEELISSLKNEKEINYTFKTANDFSTPYEKCLANYVGAWKEKKWSKMALYTQKSQNTTADELKNYFDNTKIVGFKIISAIKQPDDYVKNWYSIKFEVKIIPMISHKGVQTKILQGNVINENGNWGVNMTSTIGGLY